MNQTEFLGESYIPKGKEYVNHLGKMVKTGEGRGEPHINQPSPEHHKTAWLWHRTIRDAYAGREGHNKLKSKVYEVKALRHNRLMVHHGIKAGLSDEDINESNFSESKNLGSKTTMKLTKENLDLIKQKNHVRFGEVATAVLESAIAEKIRSMKPSVVAERFGLNENIGFVNSDEHGEPTLDQPHHYAHTRAADWHMHEWNKAKAYYTNAGDDSPEQDHAVHNMEYHKAKYNHHIKKARAKSVSESSELTENESTKIVTYKNGHVTWERLHPSGMHLVKVYKGNELHDKVKTDDHHTARDYFNSFKKIAKNS